MAIFGSSPDPESSLITKEFEKIEHHNNTLRMSARQLVHVYR